MSDVKTKITGIISNLTSLEVATFTKKESTNVPINMDFGTDGNIGTSGIFTSIRSTLADEELVGYVRFELDGDTVAFVNNNPAYADVLEYHKEMISAGQESRKALFETIKGVFK